MKITSIADLRELYDQPTGRAKNKQLSSLDKHTVHYINTSPFLVLATTNSNGQMDASPRGGEAGFVKVRDAKTIIIPDAKGNNRIDSLTNIVESNTVGLLFLIPGIDETLRINGSAHISTDQELLDMFPVMKHPPKTCIVVEVKEVFLHCAKALMRSRLWDQKYHIERSDFPTMGEMLKDQLGSDGSPESQEDMVKRYEKDL